MGSQAFTYALIAYFVIVSIFVGLLSYGGLLSDGSITVTQNEAINSYGPNTTYSTVIPDSASSWNVGTYITDLFGFFVFGVELDGVGAFMWIIRLVFVYIPLLFLVLSIYYAIRGT